MFYATCILVFSVISIVVSLIETKKSLHKIQTMAYFSCPVNVLRGQSENEMLQIESKDLVPGDIIEIPENSKVPCDLILLEGSCVVTEAILTGESVPVIKSAIPFTEDMYDPKNH